MCPDKWGNVFTVLCLMHSASPPHIPTIIHCFTKTHHDIFCCTRTRYCLGSPTFQRSCCGDCSVCCNNILQSDVFWELREEQWITGRGGGNQPWSHAPISFTILLPMGEDSEGYVGGGGDPQKVVLAHWVRQVGRYWLCHCYYEVRLFCLVHLVVSFAQDI